MRFAPRSLGVLPLAALGAALATAQGTGGSVSAGALKACAVIAAPSERLACYDQLAGRVPSPVAATATPSTSPPGAPTPSPIVAPAAAVGTAASVAAGAPIAPPAPPPKEAFGLYAAEHPHAAVDATPSLTALVIGFGMNPNGHPTVTLEGGAVWELDNSDPLLKAGESVIIKRAALGSFLMTTPTGRTHRVHRVH